MKRKYSIEVSIYTNNSKIASNCNAINFINPAGSGIDFTINNIPVAQGASLEIAGWQDETDITSYELSFGTGNGQCIVVKKVYI